MANSAPRALTGSAPLSAAPTTAPDFFVLASDGERCPAYRERIGRVAKGFRSEVYVHHPDGREILTPEQVLDLIAAGRVVSSVDVPSGDGMPVDIAVSYIATPPVEAAPIRPLSDRGAAIRRMPVAATRWEAMRRLLNARCTAYAKQILAEGATSKEIRETANDLRHGAARAASAERRYRKDIPLGLREAVSSSMALDLGGARGSEEMEHAVSHVEHLMYKDGVDLDALDAEFRARQARQAGVRSAYADEVTA